MGLRSGYFRPARNICIYICITLYVFMGASCSTAQSPRLHPEFDVTEEDLSGYIKDLPENLQESIKNKPEVFLEYVKRALVIPHELTVLVDKSHPLDGDYEPADLIPLTNLNLALNRGDLRLRSVVLPDVLAMNESARQNGIVLDFSSTYRSYDYQASVYQRNVEAYGKETADRESAQPGKSQHQLGTTVDFGSISDEFADTPAGRWLYEHAWRFGFSLSYPAGYEHLTGYRHEIWHYRFITRELALLEREFFGSIQHYLLTFLHDNRLDLLSKHTGTTGNAES